MGGQGGRKKGKKGEGGRASADLEGLSGRGTWSSNGGWRRPAPNQDLVRKINSGRCFENRLWEINRFSSKGALEP